MKHEIIWLSEPEDHDYPAAESYLSLLFPHSEAAKIVGRLRLGKVVKFKAKDIARASGLPLLGRDNRHVAHNLDKIHDGKELSPLLLVRGTSLIVADGFHRLSAVHSLDEDADVHCKIV
ncbi:hypothetical protein [Burkholderia multivorans]|uniref:hypothetical protein n=1 Tax=Burkholderia multivorans TaxID=87883 RepID=UPI0021C09960|nr:hypothetical protein [Burkholderia multivorans]MDR9052044.1 hypothetical protein [Burkholderia multivorans]MDR9060116.1 hypothetical protein [Burkholderia multivorans]MDR9062421.1 hypothetical protein [Burkholderia multivorans]MDR9070380.1 hypothetical protein [Burkholderia multivorans]MDR9076556.1 hypothetical protein [Burkholderia multivorans]